MNVNCRQCGNKVPREGAKRRDYDHVNQRYSEWRANPTAGAPAVSTSMSAIDPSGFFCTMRCAARYGVRAVKGMIP